MLSSFAYSLQIITQRINGKLSFQLHNTPYIHITYTLNLPAPHATVIKVMEFLGWQYEIERDFLIFWKTV